MKKILILVASAAALCFHSCNRNSNQIAVDCDMPDTVALSSEVAYLKNYLEERGIDAVQHPSGVFYIIEEEGGDTKLEACYNVSANYTCHTLRGDFVDKGEETPFNLYDQSLLPGFRIGFSAVGEGGKIRLYLPPSIAYGEKGAAPAIGSNEYIVFDIEVLKATRVYTRSYY